jgi:hypothetical protein
MDFNDYRSPSTVRSIFNNIPMVLRNDPFVRGLAAAGCRIVYRGPRTNRNTYGTLKEDARWFSIYPPSQRWDHVLQKRIWPWEENGYDTVCRQMQLETDIEWENNLMREQISRLKASFDRFCKLNNELEELEKITGL